MSIRRTTADGCSAGNPNACLFIEDTRQSYWEDYTNSILNPLLICVAYYGSAYYIKAFQDAVEIFFNKDVFLAINKDGDKLCWKVDIWNPCQKVKGRNCWLHFVPV